jgi:hypothetical protein
MTAGTRPPATPPSRAAGIALAVLAIIDAAAILALAWACYDTFREFSALAGDAVICAILLVVVAMFVAGAAFAWRRRRITLAIVLAAVPAVPTVLLGVALAVFVATFTHQR